jgi:hypothetical protein
MRKIGLLALVITVLLSGCSVRSISNSGYNPGGYYPRGGDNNPFYKGELSEFDVLGIDAGMVRFGSSQNPFYHFSRRP